MGEILIPDWARMLANSFALHGGATRARMRLEADLESMRKHPTGVIVKITPEETLVTIIEALKVLEQREEETRKRMEAAQRAERGQNGEWHDEGYPHGPHGPF